MFLLFANGFGMDSFHFIDPIIELGKCNASQTFLKWWWARVNTCNFDKPSLSIYTYQQSRSIWEYKETTTCFHPIICKDGNLCIVSVKKTFVRPRSLFYWVNLSRHGLFAYNGTIDLVYLNTLASAWSYFHRLC